MTNPRVLGCGGDGRLGALLDRQARAHEEHNREWAEQAEQADADEADGGR